MHRDEVAFGDYAFKLHVQFGVGFDISCGGRRLFLGVRRGVGVVLAVVCADVLFHGLGYFVLVEDIISKHSFAKRLLNDKSLSICACIIFFSIP